MFSFGVYSIGGPRIMEWVVYPFSNVSSRPRNQTGVSCIAGGFFINWAIREAPVGIVILEKYSLIAGIKCEWIKGLPDTIRICICQGKTKNPSLSLHRLCSWPGVSSWLREPTFGWSCGRFLRGWPAPLDASRCGCCKVVVCATRGWEGVLWGSLAGRICSCLSCRKDSILGIWISLTGGQDGSREQGMKDKAC